MIELAVRDRVLDGGGKDKEVMDEYVEQMARNHAKLIDENFWLVVKKKPKWMPSFLYKAVIKKLVELQRHVP